MILDKCKEEVIFLKRNHVSYFLSGLLFVFLGSLISGLGFVGVVSLGKVTSVLSAGDTSSNFARVIFSIVYGAFLIALCWLTGKFIVPRYRNR